MAKEIDGSGKLMAGNSTPAFLAQRESPVDVTLSLAVAAMSPALAWPAAICSFPWRKNRPTNFSSVSRVIFVAVPSGFIRPEKTRIKEIRPVYGSEIVLKTKAENGASVDGWTAWSWPLTLALTPSLSRGEGR